MQTRTSRRRAALAALAISATLLAACGSSGGGAATTPVKIRITGAAGDTAAARTAEAAGGADAKMAAGAVPAIGFAPTEYVVAGTLPALDDDAAAWHLPAASGVGRDDVAKLAEQLGLEGDVREAPAEEGGGWRVGATDYTAPWLSVDRTGAGSWYYDAAAFASVQVACAPVTAEDGAAKPAPAEPAPADAATGTEPAARGAAPAPDCPVPTPPAGVPSADQARTSAMALAKALGVVPDAADVRVEGDEWGRYVTWSLRLDGVPSPLVFSAVYGGQGKLTSASGYLARPERAADYPRVGTAAALDELRSGASFWGGPLPMTGDVAVTNGGGEAGAAGAGAASGPPATMVEGAVAPSTPACDPAADCVPGSTTPPEPVRVTITEVQPALTMLWGADGDVWLVPAYRFLSADGEVATVPAIDPSYVEQVAPATDTAAAADIGATRGGAPAPAPAPVGAAEPAATKP